MDIEIPNENIAGEDIKNLLSNPNVQMRGDKYFREAVRYFQAPYGELHQESIEASVLQKRLSHITFAILRHFSVDYLTKVSSELIQKWIQDFKQPVFNSNLFVEIRPLVIALFFELIFGRKISQEQLLIFTQAVANVQDTIKGTALRSLPIRMRMSEDIKKNLDQSVLSKFVQEKDLEGIEPEVVAKHISCVFFHTGVVQITELVCHTLTEIYRNNDVLCQLQPLIHQLNSPLEITKIESPNYLDSVLNESLRLFPLIGRTNRQVSKSFTFKNLPLEKDSVVYLNFSKCHKYNWDNADSFKPSRWEEKSGELNSAKIQKEHFIPFGIGPRSCPAESFSRTIAKALIVTILKYTNLTIPSNFVHTRRLPQGVPVVVSLNPCVVELGVNLPPRDVSVADLLIPLTRQAELMDPSESVELSISLTLLKMLKNMGNYRLIIYNFYPLIRNIDIWIHFQAKRFIKK